MYEKHTCMKNLLPSPNISLTNCKIYHTTDHQYLKYGYKINLRFEILLLLVYIYGK